ncbi:hypothetical protein FNV43_RR05813 [Rhamnella rubrinervis]|uniref:Ubiquitin-like protease family profile domain-containing protein n=1 Tax=Rhamnella rubrinervis TaxID=2594499 RepID=A0A8K0MR05_9ROSA|nr:hypothetical protein FNV43_RR05813 [Rhamnella rubrinervis]
MASDSPFYGENRANIGDLGRVRRTCRTIGPYSNTVLLGGDKKRLVRNDNFNIIQNDDLCSRYPWGTLSYDATISSLRSRIKLGREVANYSVSRFPLTFQEMRSSSSLSPPSAVPVWDTFTPIDLAERAALSAFIDNPSTTVHPGDYDAIEKSSFESILASGAWLDDLEVDVALYYIRRRIINSPQMYDQRAIVTDYMFWSSIHARYTKYLKKQSEHGEEDELSDTADWEKEMKDSPFDMYALGMLPVESKSWLEVDYVYVPVNNDNKHWLAAKVDIWNQTITLYNPNNAMSQDEFQCRNAKCLSILFPYLLMIHGYYDLYPELKVEGNSNLEPFDVKCKSATNIPQQKVSGDCRTCHLAGPNYHFYYRMARRTCIMVGPPCPSAGLNHKSDHLTKDLKNGRPAIISRPSAISVLIIDKKIKYQDLVMRVLPT